MASSTASAVKAALLTLLSAETTLAGVQIDYSDPGAEIGAEEIFYGRTLQTEKPDSLGQRSQREKYSLEVYVYAKQDGNDPQSCEERCWDLVAGLENVVRANNGPQGPLTNALSPGAGWVVMESVTMTPFTFQGARIAEALCKVYVEAKK